MSRRITPRVFGVAVVAVVWSCRPAGASAGTDWIATNPAWTAEGNQYYANFGSSVAFAGDVNGDGFADVLVGAPNIDDGQTNEGRAFLFFGSATGAATAPAWTVAGEQAQAVFGGSVASAGDVNGDGYADVIVGASTFDNGHVD